MITQDLGIATAYGYAKSKGYTGTEAEFAELMASYASTAQTAIEAADRAVEANTAAQSAKTDAAASKTAAQTAAQTATSKASEASQSASTATTKASEASRSASTASTAASSASTSAQTATTAATTATTKASEASESATTASTAKTDAESARDAAAQSASQAAASAASIDPDEFDRKIYAAFATDTATGAIAHFEDGADSIPMKDVLVHIEPVQAGSGDPSPDNVRAITGWTAAKVTRCGKNLLKKAKESSTMNGITWTLNDDGSITALGTSTGRSYIRVLTSDMDFYTLPKGTYTYSLSMTGSDYANIKSLIGSYKGTQYYRNVCIVHNSKHFVDNFTWNDSDLTATLDIVIEVEQANQTVNCTIYPQLELGSTATDYEPYSGQTYDITFPTDAGIVYGGTLDVTTGELVVDRKLITINEIVERSINAGALLLNGVVGAYNVGSVSGQTQYAAVCSMLPNMGVTTIANMQNISMAQWATSFRLKDTECETIEAYMTKYGNAQLCYYLATPITYQLTTQEITSLLGVNNLWADTGNTEVEYRADTKMYITKKITEAVSALS